MKTKFEYQSTAVICYPRAKQVTCLYAGKEYVNVGKSYEIHTEIRWYLLQVIFLIGKITVSIILVGIPLLFPAYRKSTFNTLREIQHGREKIVHYIPKAVSLTNHTDTFEKLMSEMLGGSLRTYRTALEMRYFIDLDFENHSMKKEFIVKSSDQDPISSNLICQKMRDIEKEMKKVIREDLGQLIQTKWFILARDQHDHFQEMHSIHIPHMHKYEIKHSNSLTEEDLERIYDEMGLPENHEQRYNNEFIPGPFYEELPN